MKLYTGIGDKGSTTLYGGCETSKTDERIAATGALDELNAALGLVLTLTDPQEEKILLTAQHQLFIVGADIATSEKDKWQLTEEHVKELEEATDRIGKQIPQQKHFVLPGGSKEGAWLHYARAVCRRAETKVIEASEKHDINPNLKVYMNRLSSLLFGLAKLENKEQGETQVDYSARF